MGQNVYSFKVAIDKGYQPRNYTYDPAQIPLGEFDAILDFKAWSKRIIAINCYFTRVETNEKFVVTVYCCNKTGRFETSGSLVNFAECTIGIVYQIEVGLNHKNRIVLLKVVQ